MADKLIQSAVYIFDNEESIIVFTNVKNLQAIKSAFTFNISQHMIKSNFEINQQEKDVLEFVNWE